MSTSKYIRLERTPYDTLAVTGTMQNKTEQLNILFSAAADICFNAAPPQMSADEVIEEIVEMARIVAQEVAMR